MSNMHKAYTVAAKAVRKRLEKFAPDDLALLDAIPKKEVSVYSGTFDSVEQILKLVGIPYQMDPDASGIRSGIVFVNCSSQFQLADPNKLAAAVEGGCWLVSSDWALGRFISKGFPGTIQAGTKNTADEVVAVEPSRDSVFSNVVVLGMDPQWWLEGQSHPIEILDFEKVRVEAASHELLTRYEHPPVAVSFDWGKGFVYHVISHFWNKRSRTPSDQYNKPAEDFLKQGMGLENAEIQALFQETDTQASTQNFASIQTAVTSTELVVQLCIRAAKKNAIKPNKGNKKSLFNFRR